MDQRMNIAGNLLKVDKERLRDYYGQHMMLVEELLIVAVTITFAATLLFLPLLLIAWVVAYFAALVIYNRIFVKTAEEEHYPLGTLRLIRLRRVSAILSWLVAILLLALFYLFGVLGKNWSQMSFGEFIVNIAFVLQILVMLVAFTTPILLTTYFHLVAISYVSQVKMARLSFRAFLVEMKLAAIETSTKTRIGLTKNCLRLLRNGLHYYNRYLYRNTPSHHEVVRIDDYYRASSGLILIGKEDEVGLLVRQIRVILGCITGRDVKHDPRKLLTALRNIRLAQENRNYSVSDLLNMIETLTPSERFSRWLKSPYFGFVIGAVTIVWFLLAYLKIM
jgi:hypothetical protein